MDDQVVVRLILSGVYPFYNTYGKFLYLLDEKGTITGTKQADNFNKHFDRVIYFLGEGQLSDDQKAELDKYGMRSEKGYVITDLKTGHKTHY